ncbi:MAG TPA: hypothetical protein VFI65_05565 [Streptosporangiaceae bacterium]|nr:hypothetical protein [Streptosporangiaceae bacterium]
MKVRLFLTAALAAILISGAQGALAASSARSVGAAPVVFSISSCSGNSFCLATGIRPGHGAVPFIEMWNGKAWRIIANPSGFNGNVTCGTPTFCLAAGSTPKSRSAEFQWTGKAWRRFKPTPPVPNIGCLSAKFCVALNGIDVYNDEVYWTGGTTWQTMPQSGVGCGGAWCQIDEFGCASATLCWDTGDYCGDSDCDNGTFNWNDLWTGTTWADDTNVGFGVGEACAGRSFCMNLHLPDSASISDDWGKTWQNASGQLAASCRKLARCTFPTRAVCASTHFCLALPGQDPTGALIWNGAKWGIARLTQIAGHLPKMDGLVCGSPTNCMASGTYQRTPRGAAQPAVEHWNGKSWSIIPIAKP